MPAVAVVDKGWTVPACDATFKFRFKLGNVGGVWDKPNKVWTLPNNAAAADLVEELREAGAVVNEIGVGSTQPVSKIFSGVKTSGIPYDALVSVALAKLEELPSKSWSINDLSSVVSAATGYNNLPALTVLFNALASAGKIHRWYKGTRAFLKHKPNDVPESEAVKEAIDKAKAEIAAAHSQMLKVASDAAAKISEAEERAAAAEKKAAETKAESRIVAVQLKNGAKVVKTTKGMFHAKFERLLKLAQNRKNMFIYGPTGCGKSFICGQLAETLGLKFAHVSCTSGMSESALGGRLLPVGKQGTFEYVIAEFVDCYENGGLFLLDEMDAADPNVLLVINSALANGKMAVTNRPKQPYAIRHKDFICAAAANTVGTGASRMYSGRNKLDAATLDRFGIGKVFMDYDERVEEMLCPDAELRSTLWKWRKAIRTHNLERAMSSRFMQDAHDMFSDGWTITEISEAFFEGWREDEVNKVKNFYG